MQQHHLNVRNLQGPRDKYLWREAIHLNQYGEMCLSDTNDNKLTTAAVTVGKEHLVNQTDEKKPQFITGSVNKRGERDSGRCFFVK